MLAENEAHMDTHRGWRTRNTQKGQSGNKTRARTVVKRGLCKQASTAV